MCLNYAESSVSSLFHAREWKISFLQRPYVGIEDKSNVALQLAALEIELCRRGCVTKHKEIARASNQVLFYKDLATTLVFEEFEEMLDRELYRILYVEN